MLSLWVKLSIYRKFKFKKLSFNRIGIRFLATAFLITHQRSFKFHLRSVVYVVTGKNASGRHHLEN